MYPNLYVWDLHFYWICLVAVHIILLALVCACKEAQGPLDLQRVLACECVCVYICVSVSFFDLSDQLVYVSCTYWFFCGAAVSPAAFSLYRQQSKEEKKWGRWWWRGMGE